MADRCEVYDGTPLAFRFDENDDPSVDHGWIGADARGVWITEDPEYSLALRCPDLYDVVDDFWLGHRELTRDDLSRLTARQYYAKLAMVQAHAREEARAIKRAKEPPEG